MQLNMNNADVLAPVKKANKQLAIVKRIDELPAWVEKKRVPVEKKKETVNTVSSWTMPQMPDGYIKARHTDFF